MSYDPNQPYGQQSPYGQPQQQPSPYGQPPYGQPQQPYGGVSPMLGFAPRRVKKRRNIGGTIGGVIGLLGLLVGLVAVLNAFGVNTGIDFSSLIGGPSATATKQYYEAIKNQDYAAAYTHLDPTQIPFFAISLEPGQQINESLFTQKAQAFDTAKGKVRAYSIGNFSVETSNGFGEAVFTVHVMRNTAYDVHIQLMQQGSDNWKIVNFNSL